LDWPEFAELMGAYPTSHREPTEQVWLKIDDPSSPLTASFGGRELLYQDEYSRFTEPGYSRDKLHVLLTIDVDRTDLGQPPPPSPIRQNMGRADSDYAVAWIHKYGQGRVFYTVMGHNPTLFMTPELARLELAGLQYVLGDLAADDTPSNKSRAASSDTAKTATGR
jgi:uncharacterized protein